MQELSPKASPNGSALALYWDGCERLRTVANLETTGREQGSTPRPPELNENPSLRIWENLFGDPWSLGPLQNARRLCKRTLSLTHCSLTHACTPSLTHSLTLSPFVGRTRVELNERERERVQTERERETEREWEGAITTQHPFVGHPRVKFRVGRSHCNAASLLWATRGLNLE